MRRALREFVIKGIKTSIPFHRVVMEHPKFLAGTYDTGFIDSEILPGGQTSLPPNQEEKDIAIMLATIAAFKRDTERASRAAQSSSGGAAGSAWKAAGRRSRMQGGR